MAYADGELRGVGGWLAFFLVTLGLFTPLTSLISVAILSAQPELERAYGDLLGPLITGEWVLAGLTCAAAWFAAVRMLTIHNWLSVKITLGALWSIAALTVIGEPLMVSMVAGLSFGDVFASDGAGMFRPLVYCTIWTLYLLQSERVSNTYRGEPEADELAELFE